MPLGETGAGGGKEERHEVVRPFRRWDPRQGDAHCLAVLAPTTSDVVRFAGGLLVDRALAGWEVRVLTADPVDPLPLRILGAVPEDLESRLAEPHGAPCTQAVLVDAELFARDARARRWVRQAIGQGDEDVWFWTAPCPTRPGVRVGEVRHRLSGAARAFKRQAMIAAKVDSNVVELDERFGVAARGVTRSRWGRSPGRIESA